MIYSHLVGDCLLASLPLNSLDLPSSQLKWSLPPLISGNLVKNCGGGIKDLVLSMTYNITIFIFYSVFLFIANCLHSDWERWAHFHHANSGGDGRLPFHDPTCVRGGV